MNVMEAHSGERRFTIGEFLYDSLVPEDCTTILQEALKNRADVKLQPEKYSTDHQVWTSNSLGVTQICSSNLTLEYSNKLTVLGTPVYSADGCLGNKYCSYFLVSKLKYPQITTLDQAFNELSGLTMAVNSFGSCSGWLQFLNTLSNYLQRPIHNTSSVLPFSRLLQTGSHAGSVRAIDSGEADIAAIDCISFQLLRRGSPALFTHIAIIGQSGYMLSPAFVTSNAHSIDRIDLFRRALVDLLSSQDEQLQRYRQASLVTGIDTSTTVEQYQSAIQSLILNIRCNPWLNCLLDELPPGQTPPLRHLRIITLQLENDSNSRFQVEVISKARQDDRQWPETDRNFMKRLRTAMVQYILNEISLAFHTHTLSHKPFEENHLKVVLESTLQSLVMRGEQFVPVPCEGLRRKGKLILPSYHGVLMILLSISTTSDTLNVSNDEILPIIWSYPLTPLLLHKLILSIIQSNPELSPSLTLHCAYFFGTTAAHTVDHSTNTPEASQVADLLLKRVWSADLALSQRLIHLGDSLGIWAYLSAPRGNDRYDWGNLVIGRDSQALTEWRMSDGHNAGTQVLAPLYYEHIRLHRVEYTHGLLCDDRSSRWYQTIFLQSMEANTEQIAEQNNNLKYQSAQEIVKQLYQESPIASEIGDAGENKEGDEFLPKKMFRRQMVLWCNEDAMSSLSEQVLGLDEKILGEKVLVREYYEQLRGRGYLG